MKKILGFLFVLVLVLGLAGCASNDAPELLLTPDYEQADTQPETAPEQEPEPEPEQEPDTEPEPEQESDPEPEPQPDPEPAQQASSLVGAWDWIGMPYYVLYEDGTGTMAGMPILWSARDGILSVCVTPETCGNTCIAPADWYYVITGNELVLTSTLMAELTFTYIRG